jgi:RimJ/RimL family protein N-acetyltransferase
MVTLRNVEITDATVLYYHLSNPRVLRYSRLKPNSEQEMEEYIRFLIKSEEEQKLIARVIANDFNSPIGMIILWDYCPFRREGFLATWLGEEHWGKGYNQIAKELFLNELFYVSYLNKVYLLIRSNNERSIAASKKLNYVYEVGFEEDIELRDFYKDKIKEEHIVFCIYKDLYINKELSS